VLTIGEWCLTDQGPQPGVVGFISEMGELFVEHADLVPQIRDLTRDVS
jgi:hypothetical protein